MPERTRYVQPVGVAGPSNGSSPYHSPAYTLSLSPMGLMSPPPLSHTRSLYTCAPLPALPGMPGHIHDVLSGAHMLAFDVSYDPAYIVSASPGLSPRVLAEPATTPSLPCVTISCDHLPWLITVYPSSSKPGAWVTVADVLNAIYRDLHRPLQKEGLDTVPVSWQPYMASVQQAFHSRCRRLAHTVHPAAADSEARKGIRRIDFLLGKHRFYGLLPTRESPDVWKLSVSS